MINSRGTNALPLPESGRILLWYGWRDDPENEDKKWLKKWFVKATFQCGKMLLDGTRCHPTCLRDNEICLILY